MKNKEYSRFLRNVLIFLSPTSIILVLYFIWDPFFVVKKINPRYIKNEKAYPVTSDRDFSSTRLFDLNTPRYKYDSFIFGSSRSVVYTISDWEKLIDSNSSCFHFDALGESLYALTKKIEYIDSKNNPIKNALLIFDYSLLNQDKASTELIFQISPQLVNYKNFIPFHTKFIYAFFQPNFFLSFVHYKITGKVSQYSIKKRILLDYSIVYFDPKTNEGRELLNINSKDIFYDRDTTIQSVYPICIKQTQKKLLTQIEKIFQKHGTNYKVIISPLYDQKKLNPEDLAYLNETFGQENVFDFSGINEITNNYLNYLETSHYKPSTATKIMEIIYKKEMPSVGSQDTIGICK